MKFRLVPVIHRYLGLVIASLLDFELKLDVVESTMDVTDLVANYIKATAPQPFGRTCGKCIPSDFENRYHNAQDKLKMASHIS